MNEHIVTPFPLALGPSMALTPRPLVSCCPQDPGSTLVGGSSSNHHLSNNKKVHHQFSTAHHHSSSPFRSSSAGSLHRNHSFDRLVSLAPGPSTPPTTYSSPFTTYSPPLNYRHTLTSSSAAPPFPHDPTALLASAMQHGLALRGNAAATRKSSKHLPASFTYGCPPCSPLCLDE